MKVAVLDHGMGNLRSVAKALEAAGATALVTADPADATACDALCVPGQGIFRRCIDNLSSSQLDDLVRSWIGEGRPYLGICLGMQVLFDTSEERGVQPGFGIVPGRVSRLPDGVTVPHIGWNLVDGDYFYFDHSYAPYPDDASIVRGWCRHGDEFAAWIEQGSVTAVQFHPEKSGATGLSFLRDWVARS